MIYTYDSAMAGAPVLSGTAGALRTLLKAVLVDGFGAGLVSTLAVASNVATATFAAAHPYRVGSIVQIAGATPAGLNGQKRVVSTTVNSITFATTGIADGTATGSRASFTSAGALDNQGVPFIIGKSAGGTAENLFHGFMANFRATKGIARYKGNFTPPNAPHPTFISGAGDAGFVSPAVHASTPVGVHVAASATVPTHSTGSAPQLQLARDVEFGGPGTVFGTTKTKGTPNAPTKARVSLLRDRDKLLARQVWSDPATGAFSFTDIDTTQKFTTLAEDVEGNFRPVAANKLTPEVTP